MKDRQSLVCVLAHPDDFIAEGVLAQQHPSIHIPDPVLNRVAEEGSHPVKIIELSDGEMQTKLHVVIKL